MCGKIINGIGRIFGRERCASTAAAFTGITARSRALACQQPGDKDPEEDRGTFGHLACQPGHGYTAP